MRRLCTILCLSLISAATAMAQNKAYAKFNAEGSTIGLYDLLPHDSECSEIRIVSGTIRKVMLDVGETSYSYTFTIDLGGKSQKIGVEIQNGDILRPDVEDIIVPKRRVRVLVRQCGRGEIWLAQEVRRR